MGFANVEPGKVQSVSLPPPLAAAAGTWCYGVVIADQDERGAPAATVTVTFTNQSPSASFDVQPQPESGPNCFATQSTPTAKYSSWTERTTFSTR